MKRAIELLDENAASNFPNLVIYHLTLDLGPPELRLYEFERFRQVTPSQERAILAFLQYINGRSTADDWFSRCAKEALDSYWGKPDRERFRGVESLL